MPRDLTPYLEGGGQPGYLEDPIPVMHREGPERLDMGSQSIAIIEKGDPYMLQSLKKRFDREDEGFTLIELMVVVLIIAILLAIAIPTFLGARDRANDRAAQSSLRNALTAAKTLYTDSQDYSIATAASLPSIEPSLSYATNASGSSDFKMVAVDPGTSPSSAWAGAALSKTGTCFGIKDTSTGTQYAKFTPSGGAVCAPSGMTFSATSKW